MNERSPSDATILGRTTFRNQGKLFGILQQDRLHHMYVVGRTGTGKSTLLYNMIRQDVEHGRGCALLDPHGDLVERLVQEIPTRRADRLVYFDVPNPRCELGFNPLASVPPRERTLATAGMLETFKKLWPEFWGPRSEHVLRNTLLALLEQPQPNLADALRLFDDSAHRKSAAARIANGQVRRFWLKEFEGYGARLRAEAVAPLQNKIGAFLADPLLKGILTARGRGMELRRVMDDGRILLVNLSKGKLGEDCSSLLGSLMVSQIGLAALSRAAVSETERRHFFVYLDEFQTFATLSLVSMLSELRKYRVGFVLAHQYLGQLEEGVKEAALGNVGTIVAFRVGLEDAGVLQREFHPELTAVDLASLPNYQVYVRMLVGGRVTRGFSGETITM